MLICGYLLPWAATPRAWLATSPGCTPTDGAVLVKGPRSVIHTSIFLSVYTQRNPVFLCFGITRIRPSCLAIHITRNAKDRSIGTAQAMQHVVLLPITVPLHPSYVTLGLPHGGLCNRLSPKKDR